MRLIDRVCHIELLEILELPRDEYALTGGAWLAIMDIRHNLDIDIVISEDLNRNYESYLSRLSNVEREQVSSYIDKSGKHGKKQMKIAKANSLSHLIHNFSVVIDGHRFISYKLFSAYKKPRNRVKDKRDKKYMKKFFEHNRHLSPIYKDIFK